MRRTAIATGVGAWLLLFGGPKAPAQKPPLLPEKDVAALANEVSGETAKRNLEGIARFHRQRGSKGFHEAAELVAERLRAYGLQDAAILQFPADGKIFYGTQRSRPAWDADFAELWEVAKEVNEVKEKRSNKSDPHGVGVNEWLAASGEKKMASYEAMPIVLAEDSQSAEVSADLVDVGEGTKESDYAGKDVKGKIVLVSAQPGAVQDLAVGKFGAAGIVSYAQNQKTAWWGEDENLIGQGSLARPARTIRFYWPPEIEGTMALLTSPPRTYKMELDTKRSFDGSVPLPQSGGGSLTQTGPALAKRVKAVVHMDMVGGGPETKAVFHVTRGPMSLPSFVHDVAWAFAEWVNEQSYKYAATGKAEYPLVAPEGGKEPLRAEFSPYSMGSDHDVYQDSSFKIPAIYLNDWPDRYIHTNFDSAANIDPTKLKRAAFIGAASGYFLTNSEQAKSRVVIENEYHADLAIASLRGKRGE